MKSSLEVQQQMSVLSSHVQENLSGMHVVKAYSQEEFQTQQFIGLNKDYEVKSMEMAKMRGIVNPVMQGINGLTVLIVIWYGGVRVMRGDLVGGGYRRLHRLSQRARLADGGLWLDAVSGRARPGGDAPARRDSRNANRRSPARRRRIARASDSKTASSFAMSPSLTSSQRNGNRALEGISFKLAGRQVGGTGRPHRFGQEHGGATGAAAD